MNDRERGSDRFFAGLFTELKPTFYWRHPSKQAWQGYLAEQAREDAQPDLEELLRWNDKRLQLHHHRLTCGRCARRVMALRQSPTAQRWRPIWQWQSSRLVAYGALAMLLIAISLWILIPTGNKTTDCCRPPTYGDVGGGGLGGF